MRNTLHTNSMSDQLHSQSDMGIKYKNIMNFILMGNHQDDNM